MKRAQLLASRRNNLRRQLKFESLESRHLLAADLWNAKTHEEIQRDESISFSRVVEQQFQTINVDVLRTYIQTELNDSSDAAVISIPRPDGGFDQFEFEPSDILPTSLQERYSSIRAYQGVGVDDPNSLLRFEVTARGFHAQVLDDAGTYYVDPFYHLETDVYSSYFAAGEFEPLGFSPYESEAQLHNRESEDSAQQLRDLLGDENGNSLATFANRIGERSGEQLQTFRTAISTSGGYAQFHGGTIETAMSALVTSLNRVDGIYTRDLTISFQLVDDNDQLIFLDPANDPFTNDDAFALLGENQDTIDNIIGDANYDIGHVFTTGGGGLARLGSVGMSGIKAQGVTGLPAPINDVFDVDFVAHEIGHQFGGAHTFNGVDGACEFARSGGAAFEPGSGTTIQAYAGICASDNLQPNSDPFFHSFSFDQIINHTDVVIPNVGQRTPTGNTAPTVAPELGFEFVIPARTPFVLEAIGNDAESPESITYTRNQRDLGPAQPVRAPDNGQSPLFRFYPATESGDRFFLRLSDLLDGTTTLGEQLPTTNRELNFRVVARDNDPSGGGIGSSGVRIRVIDTGESFEVTSHNTTESWTGLDSQTVTWNVAGTDGSGINADAVNVFVSVDGGQTFPFFAAENLPNTGTGQINVPNVDTTQARFMIRDADGIFLDVNDADLTIEAVPIEVDLGDENAIFVENSLPTSIAPQANISSASLTRLDGPVLEVDIVANGQIEDRLGFIPAVNSNSVVLIGNRISISGVEIGEVTDIGERLRLVFNQNAGFEEAQQVIRAVGFEHLSEGPSAAIRTVQFTFAQTLSRTTTVEVTPVNDAPEIATTALPQILEDAEIVAGQQINQLFSATTTDVDFGSFLSGVAIVGNTTPLSQGRWQFSSSGGQLFVDLPAVDDGTLRLAISSTSFIRFLPAADFFGVPTPLTIRAIDDSFRGNFSINSVPAYLASNLVGGQSPVSSSRGELSVFVQPINDSPQVTVDRINFVVTQDQPIDGAIPEGAIVDVDDAFLSYNVTSRDGSSIPDWLTFDPFTPGFIGTPGSDDVFDLNLILTATDSGAESVSVPVDISVINVNDPPGEIRFGVIPGLENTPGVTLGRASVDDPDGDQIIWTIEDDRFVVINGSIRPRNSVILDLETEQTIRTTITATDVGEPPLSVSREIVLAKLDKNEFTPSTEPVIFELNRGEQRSEVLGQLTATDNDSLQNIFYEIIEDESGLFQIDRTTGEITTVGGVDLDQRERDSYRVIVRATDDGISARSRAVTVDVILTEEIEVTLATEVHRIPIRTNRFSLGRLTGTDQNGATNYRFNVLDDRFVLSNGVLQLAPGFSFGPEDIPGVVVPVDVTDSMTGESIGQFEISLEIFNPVPWQNFNNPLDVDHNGQISPRDALLVINDINRNSARELSELRTTEQLELPDIDVSGDNSLSPQDALLIINHINRNGVGNGEGEANVTDLSAEYLRQSAVWIAAFQSLESELKNRDR